MNHYLLTYDRKRRELAGMREFQDAHEAHVAYADLEDLYPEDDHFEVVLLGAESVGNLRYTHPRYFERVAAGQRWQAFCKKHGIVGEITSSLSDSVEGCAKHLEAHPECNDDMLCGPRLVED